MLMILFASVTLHGQVQQINSAMDKSLPPPPAQASEITKAELSEIHHIEKARTQKQIAAAQTDDQEPARRSTILNQSCTGGTIETKS
jgi:hypothetical protein